MKKNKIIITIIICIILIVILTVFLICYSFFYSDYIKIENISNIDEAYNVKTCAQKFYMYCKDYRISAPTAVCDLLDKEYINIYNINSENLKDNLAQINSDTFNIKQVYRINQKGNISTYLIKGYEVYKNNDNIKEFSFLLKIDNKRNTFSVYLNNYIVDKKINDFDKVEKIKLRVNSIKKNYNNTFDTANKDMYDNVTDIYTDYKRLCMFYERYSYEVINEQSKKDNFQNYEIYNKYILSKYKDIVMSEMKKYEVNKTDDYVIYTCYDNYGNKFVFKVYSYITYNVIIE